MLLEHEPTGECSHNFFEFSKLPRGYLLNKLTSVFRVCLVVHHEFSHNIVNVAVDARGDR